MLDLYLKGDERVRVTRKAMLALRAFDLVHFYEGHFHAYMGKEAQVSRFLDEWVEA